MVTKKKKLIKKKTIKKAVKRAVKKPKKVKKAVEPGVIFDSQIGKTDALFVSNPEPVVQVNTAPRLDPAIDEALKEFDNVKKLPAQQPQALIERESLPSPESSSVSKKSFWQRFFKR